VDTAFDVCVKGQFWLAALVTRLWLAGLPQLLPLNTCAAGRRDLEHAAALTEACRKDQEVCDIAFGGVLFACPNNFYCNESKEEVSSSVPRRWAHYDRLLRFCVALCVCRGATCAASAANAT
jgi:hypothetical protein